jgi:uncharacterized protein YndB with AHSA1/START domain
MTNATSTAAIERTLELSAPREKVWQAISDPAELQRWFPDKAQLDLSPGGKGAFSWDEYGTYRIQIVTVDPPNYLAWRGASEPDVEPEASVGATLVEWWLEDGPDGGTRLRLRESGFVRAEHREGNEQGWTQELAELVALLEAER